MQRLRARSRNEFSHACLTHHQWRSCVMGWPAPLDKVFVPRKGKQIKTLAGAYAYLLKLPK